jgi:UPF0716 protein FxsA
MKWLFFFYPWLELWSLVELGAQTSVATPLLWVLAAVVLGIAMIRFAGNQTLAHLQSAQREGALREHLLVGDVAVLVSGVLLIIPGLISDAVAVMVLIAPLRSLLARLLLANAAPSAHYRNDQGHHRDFQQEQHRAPGSDGGVTLEGEYQPVSPDTEPLAPLEHDEAGRR